jgi:hypothetical protein
LGSEGFVVLCPGLWGSLAELLEDENDEVVEEGNDEVVEDGNAGVVELLLSDGLPPWFGVGWP